MRFLVAFMLSEPLPVIVKPSASELLLPPANITARPVPQGLEFVIEFVLPAHRQRTLFVPINLIVDLSVDESPALFILIPSSHNFLFPPL